MIKDNILAFPSTKLKKIDINIENFIAGMLGNISPEQTIELVLHSSNPINITFLNDIGISSEKNIVIASGEILHLNPNYNDDVNFPVQLQDINKYNKSLIDIDRSKITGSSCLINKNIDKELLKEFIDLKNEHVELGKRLKLMEEKLCQQ